MSNVLEVFGRGLVRWVDERLDLCAPGPGRSAGNGDGGPRRGHHRLMREALHAIRAHRWSDALRRLESVLAHAGDDVRAPLAAAICCDRLDRTADCLRFLERAAVVAPDRAIARIVLGQCYERSGLADRASAAYRDAIELDETSVPAHCRLAAIELSGASDAAAADCYRALDRSYPERPEFALALAHLMLRRGDADEAIDRFERSITIEPDTWDVDDDLFVGLETATQLEGAIERLEDRIEIEPAFADTHVRLGDLYTKIGRDDAALRQYLRAVELHPDYLEATVKIGTQFLRQGRVYECADWFNRGIRINDRLLSAYCGLAFAHGLAGHEEGVRGCLDLACAIEPNSTLLLSEVARLQRRLQNENASSYDASSFDVDPAAAMDRLVDEQIGRLERIAEGRPNHATLHYHLGMLHRHRRRIEGTIHHLHRVTEIDPHHARAHVVLALIGHERRNADRVREHLTRAFAVPDDALPTSYALALMCTRPAALLNAAERFESDLPTTAGPPDFTTNMETAAQRLGLDWSLRSGGPFHAWELADRPVGRTSRIP